MPGRPRPLFRGIAASLTVLALGAGVSACGTDAQTRYADGWDDVCTGVGDAMRTFRTAVSSAATVSPDGGDAAAAAGPAPAAVQGDLLKPAQALQTSVGEQFDAAGRLQPPARWSRWHAAELRELAVRRRGIQTAVRRLATGDPDALPLLAVGSVGPSSVRAPADLRDRTPECTTLR